MNWKLRQLLAISPSARFFAGEGDAGDGGAGGGGAGDGGAGEINWHEMVGQDGGVSDAFFANEGIPEHIRNNPTIKATKNVLSGFDQLVNTQKLVGMDKLPMPGPNAPKEVWDQVWGRLGRPGDVSGYTPMTVEGASDTEKAFGEKLMASAHAANITKDQWDVFSQGFSTAGKEMLATEQQTSAEQQVVFDQATRKEWQGPAYEQNMKSAEAVLNSMCSHEENKALREMGLLNHPAGRFMLKRLFDKIGEAEPGGGSGGDPPTGASVTEAQTELTALQSDMQGALHIGHHPGHKAAIQRAEVLRSIIRSK